MLNGISVNQGLINKPPKHAAPSKEGASREKQSLEQQKQKTLPVERERATYQGRVEKIQAGRQSGMAISTYSEVEDQTYFSPTRMGLDIMA